MRKLCVIGDPIGHSLSPLIQNAMIRAAGLDCVYDAHRVAGDETSLWLKRAEQERYVGFNATMPHKENLVSLVDVLSPDASRFGAVNTVCRKNGKWYGYNTDGEGFLQALMEADMDPAGRSVLVLGAGGAAKAVVYKLVQAGAREVVVANRTPDRALSLCRQVGAGVTACDFSRENLCRYSGQSQLVINCTSLGMEGTEGQFEELSFLEELKPGGGVFDLIYRPVRTRLLEQAETLGYHTANGLGMLVWQGVLALEHFTQTKLDGNAMAAAARQALEGVI